MLKILYFGYEWDDRWRRKQRLAYELAQQPAVGSLLYINPSVQTSILDWVRGRFAPSHLGSDRHAHWDALWGRTRQVDGKVWVFTGSEKHLPLTRSTAVRQLGVLQRINRRIYVGLMRRALRRMEGDRLVIWLCYPLQVFALEAFPEQALACYDWTDDWAKFELLPVEDDQELIEWNDRILREVDVVFAVSAELYRRARAVNPQTYRMPNATDVSVLGQGQEATAMPQELVDLPRPIAGYIGQIGDKIDYALVRASAEALPEWSFVFVGNVWSNRRREVSALSELPNVFFLGRKAYHELSGYLAGFDVCTMPHLCNALTRSMDPIKLYDYLASGKPIVSTPVAGVERFSDVVYVGRNAEEFVAGLDQAVQEDDGLKGRRRGYAQENTWSRRGMEVWGVLEAQLGL